MRYTLQVPIDPAWLATDRLRLYKGSEGAADLASSVPSGGTLVKEVLIGKAAGGDTFDISFDYRAGSACTQLPVGISCVDAAGNELKDENERPITIEKLIEISQPPEPPGRPGVAATAGNDPGQAVLTWSASPDVPSS